MESYPDVLLVGGGTPTLSTVSGKPRYRRLKAVWQVYDVRFTWADADRARWASRSTTR